jgi:hypothetical protein
MKCAICGLAFEGAANQFDDALRRLQIHMLVHVYQKLTDIEGQLATPGNPEEQEAQLPDEGDTRITN